jgi:amyloid beta precursor protein binding protein 1
MEYQLFCRLYVNLQKIYLAKAEADFLVIQQRVKSILKRIGRDPDSISKAMIKSFCKNARKLKVSSYIMFYFLFVCN